jgi:hypothetical protein
LTPLIFPYLLFAEAEFQAITSAQGGLSTYHEFSDHSHREPTAGRAEKFVVKNVQWVPIQKFGLDNTHIRVESKVRIYKFCVRPISYYISRSKALLRTAAMKTQLANLGKTLRDRIRYFIWKWVMQYWRHCQCKPPLYIKKHEDKYFNRERSGIFICQHRKKPISALP